MFSFFKSRRGASAHLISKIIYVVTLRFFFVFFFLAFPPLAGPAQLNAPGHPFIIYRAVHSQYRNARHEPARIVGPRTSGRMADPRAARGGSKRLSRLDRGAGRLGGAPGRGTRARFRDDEEDRTPAQIFARKAEERLAGKARTHRAAVWTHWLWRAGPDFPPYGSGRRVRVL